MRLNEDARLMIILLGVVALVLLVAFLFAEDGAPRDYFAWYVAGGLLLDEPDHLYKPEVQAERERGLGLRHGFLPFVYPPFVALFFAPLCFLPLRGFYFTMLAGNLLLLIVCVRLMFKRYGLDKRQKETLVLVASLAFPVYFNLIAGQLAFFSLLLYLLFISDLRDGSPAAGYWAGVLAFKPPLIIVPMAVLLARRDWRAAVRAAVVSGSLLAVSFLLVGWTGLYSNLSMMSAMRAREVMRSMQNLRAVSHFMGAGEAGWVVLAVTALVLLVVLARKGTPDKWLLAGVLLTSVLISPQLHVYDLSILLLLLALGVPTGAWYQRLYILVAALPLASIWLAFPVVPFALTPLLAWVIWKMARGPGSSAVRKLSGVASS